MPYLDWGACPFEGCTYRRWRAVQATTAWTQRDHRSQALFEIKRGEWVQAITGVVITTRPGISKVLEPMVLGEGSSVPVSPGDILYTLHYVGEGYDLFWFKGRTYSDQIAGDDPSPDPPPPGTSIQIVSRPRTVWWAKIRNAKGQIGWTDQTSHFTNIDRLALWFGPDPPAAHYPTLAAPLQTGCSSVINVLRRSVQDAGSQASNVNPVARLELNTVLISRRWPSNAD